MSGRWVGDQHEANELVKVSHLCKDVHFKAFQSLSYPGLRVSQSALLGVVTTLRLGWNPIFHFSFIFAN